MKIAVLASGGDSPGIDAAIMASRLAAIARGHEIVGVAGGYVGLLAGGFPPLSARALTASRGLAEQCSVRRARSRSRRLRVRRHLQELHERAPATHFTD